MKRMLLTTVMALSVMLIASFHNTAKAQPRVGVSISYQDFYDELDPYGRWMDYPDYGYVWVPDAGPDFRPYSTNGHWVWSDEYEWIWVSDYDWGWAPFHYGRWLEDPSYGWLWVPGYEWSPAWVAWRDGGDYYGWAPLRPGINISIGFSLGGYNPPVDYWCFAPRRYISSSRIYDYCVPRRNNVTIINQTTIINNYNYNRNVFRTGPGRRDAERYAGRINSVRFRESSNPGRTGFRNNEVSVYRPNVQRDNNRSFAPRNFERADRNGGGRDNANIGRRNANNLPERREGNNNRSFDRGNNDRQSGNNNGIAERRRNVIERDKDENVQQPNRERPSRQFNGQGSNNNNQPREARPFERPNRERDNSGNANPGRPNRFEQNNEPRQARPVERQRVEMPDQNMNGRRMERSRDFNQNNSNNNPRPERREMRTETPQRQSFPQREQQQRQPQPQQQPRQFERRSDNNSGGGDNGRGHGGGRRGR